MAIVQNLKGYEVGNKEGIYPTRAVRGDLLSAETQGSTSIVKMGSLCIGLYNGGTSEITIMVIPSSNDVTESMPVKLAPAESWQGAFFNAVAVVGSTGHLDATTFYMES